jgi:hypothetical protein
MGSYLLIVLTSPTPRPMPTGVPGSSAAGNALYTLVGVVITAAITLLGILIKYMFDRSLESGRRRAELVATAEKHRHDLEVLRLEQAGARHDALRDSRRKLAATFLSETHRIYLDLVDARRKRRTGNDEPAYQTALRAIDPLVCQVTLEEWRLEATPDSVARAEALRDHLRSHDVPQGRDTTSTSWVNWKTRYWELRHAFVEHSRQDLAYDPAAIDGAADDHPRS